MIHELTPSMTQGKIVVVDEVDLVIDKYSVVFLTEGNRTVIGGMAACYLAKKIYMLSAIEQSFHTQFFAQILGMSRNHTLRFQSMTQIHTPDTATFEDRISKIIVRDDLAAYNEVLNIFRENACTSPQLLYVENQQNQFDNRLRSESEVLHIPFHTVEDAETATEVRGQIAN